jgi:hypothetical protein
MPALDRHIAISAGWIAGPAAGVAIMAAPGALGITSQVAYQASFYGGLCVFALTILVLFVHALREGERRRDKVWPISLMALGLLLFMAGAAAYFWPRSRIIAPYHGEITGVAAFDMDGQPGLLNVLTVVAIQNLGQDSTRYIAGFTLKIHFQSGFEKEAEAEPVIDRRVFRGPNGETEIDPDNTLWGREGAPPIARFRSGRLWFPFSGIPDFREMSDLDTKLTLIIKDNAGTTSASSIRLSDIKGPRISSQPFTSPPAASPASPATSK